MLDVLKNTGFPVSLLVNSEIYNHCPELPAAYCAKLRMHGKSCEIVGHGCSNAEKQVTPALVACIQHSFMQLTCCDLMSKVCRVTCMKTKRGSGF